MDEILLICFLAVIAIVATIFFVISDQKMKRVRFAQEQTRYTQLKNNREVDICVAKLVEAERNIDGIIIRYFAKENAIPHQIICDYSSSTEYLDENIGIMRFAISHLKDSSNALLSDYTEDQRISIIADVEAKLSRSEKNVEAFKEFLRRVQALPFTKMIKEECYGKFDEVYLSKIREMTRADAVGYIYNCDAFIAQGDIQRITRISPSDLLSCAWFFAIEKPFSSLDFQKAVDLFFRITKQHHADIIIANLYAKKNMGGDDTLDEPVLSLLTFQTDARILTIVASGLMWMNAYRAEHTVLQHMLNAGMEMTAKAQERLYALTNGRGNAPGGYDVKSSEDKIYFDISALAWRDDEYSGLFENLAFQDKPLAYSLAIRDENKELFIPQEITVPSASDVASKLTSVFSEEYGNMVAIHPVACIALSGSDNETMDGFLITSNACKQMGVLMHITKIGKKLIVKFYTLFVPTSTDLAVQKQQALSIYKKLSPTVTMWESSLKDTMLMAVEQLLNSSTQGGHVPSANIPNSAANEPIF